MSFLLTRRWLLFFVAVTLMASAFVWLGEWQFGRSDQKHARNEIARTNLAMDPVPIDGVMAVDRPVADEDQWSRVTVSGVYDADASIVVRYQTRDGIAGVDIATPLMRADGTGVLINRGWIRTSNVGDALTAAPEPPSGEVTVTGWVRPNGTGGSTQVDDQSVRAISSAAIGDALGIELVQGFVDAETESPAPATPLVPAELPDLGDGPHFFYGLQWWFFGVLAIFGFGYLAYDERRRARRPHAQRPHSEATAPVEN